MRALAIASLIGLTACSGIPGEPEAPSSDEVVSGSVPAEAVTVAVDRVLDGDSILVTSDGDEIDVRLFGLNAPESDECGGPEARDALRNLAADSVQLVEVERDQYGRVIGVVWTTTGAQINTELVRTGRAVTVTGAAEKAPAGIVETLVSAQEIARSEGQGLWADDACGATRPRPQVAVAITSPNPPGSDDEVLDEEFVTVSNVGDVSVQLDGWVLRDESTINRFHFPPGSVLEPGQAIDVISGCRPSEGQLAWCSERSVWNNGGDSAFLLDEFGRIVATDRYLP